jgi:alpha-amylase
MLVTKYNLDGIRIDTIPEVPKWFWKQFSESAGIFEIGEVFDGRMDFVAGYQNCCLDSVLNYPLYFTFKDVFMFGQSMYKLESTLANTKKYFNDPSVLGVFVNNHDNARFLHINQNIKRFESAIIFMLMTGKNSFIINSLYVRRYPHFLLWRRAIF